MPGNLAALARLATDMQAQLRLSDLLERVVNDAATILNTPRVSLRLLGENDALLATCRAGEPLHDGGGARWRRGEGLVGWVAEHGKPLRTGHAEADPRYESRPGSTSKLGSFVGVPFFDNETVIGVLAAVHSDSDHFTEAHEQLLIVLAGLCAPRLCMARLERMARRDELTSVLNRHGLRSTMQSPRVRSAPLTVVLVDLDHFKSINDRFGHPTGDLVLKTVAATLKRGLRGGDIVARYGGEEFVFVLPHASTAAAQLVAERARRRVAELRFDDGAGGHFSVTLSAGVATRRGLESSEDTIERADKALYGAKSAGRDRVEVETS
ncbi:MAG: sensor domain-containing diguanylate cyclase [Myxococcales bacterium]|nr:sensor domain-containing diguanylate cyclase [Myxococcales bacterium]